MSTWFPLAIIGGMKRESGEKPELTRSGEQERNPFQALERLREAMESRKRDQPVSPKTCHIAVAVVETAPCHINSSPREKERVMSRSSSMSAREIAFTKQSVITTKDWDVYQAILRRCLGKTAERKVESARK